MVEQSTEDVGRAPWLTALWRRFGNSPARAGDPSTTQRSVAGIRRRSNLDIRSSVRLLARVHAEGQYPVTWPVSPYDWLADPSLLDAWVADRGHRLLGHVAIEAVSSDPLKSLHWRELTGLDPETMAGVSRLFVDPDERGQGLGTGLIDRAVIETRRRGMVPVLDVVSASKDAIALYEKLGWRRVASYPWGPAKAKLQLRYYLPPD